VTEPARYRTVRAAPGATSWRRQAETLHQFGYRGLRARGLKGRHIEALVAEWRRQGLADGTVKSRMAHLRWLANKIDKPGIVRRDNASYGVGARYAA